MGWVVKAWKPEPLHAAEREARRLQRMAGREAADATAYLLVLEDLATELREGIRRQRRDGVPEPLRIPAKRPAPQPEPVPVREPGEIRATRSRRGRASLRDSPLSELFRARS